MQPRTKRWIKRLTIGFAVFIFLAWVLFTPIVSAIIRHEIRLQAAQYLNATLVIGHLSYRVPLGIVVHDASLTTTGADGASTPIAEVGELDLSLAKLPGAGPILVDHITLSGSTIHLTRAPDGEIEFPANLLRPQPATQGPLPRFSDVLQVRKLDIANLSVQVVDASNANSPAASARLDASAGASDSPGKYEFHAHVASHPLADLDVGGSLDADQNVLVLSKLAGSGRLADDRSLHELAPVVDEFCRQNGLFGLGAAVSIASGTTITLGADSDRWTLTGLNGELKLHGHNAEQRIHGRISFSAAGGGPLGVPLGLDYLAKLDPGTTALLTVDPKDQLSIASAQMPLPITQCVGTIQFKGGAFTINPISAQYGQQQIHLQGMGKLQADKIAIDAFVIDAAGGQIGVDHASVHLAWPHEFKLRATCSGIDLKQAKDLLRINDPQGRISGIASGSVDASGKVLPSGAIDLSALGRAHAENGDFVDLPVLSEVAQKVNSDFGKAGRLGHAGVVFSLDHDTFHLAHLAVNSPLVGVQGSGDVGVNPPHTLNLTFIVAPLGSWKATMNKTGIPLLGNIAGAIEHAVTNVTEAALYNFSVTGDAANPSIRAVPVPALTSEAKSLFDQMVTPGAINLLDLMKDQPNK